MIGINNHLHSLHLTIHLNTKPNINYKYVQKHIRALILSLDAEEYSFKSNTSNSSLSIEMYATVPSTAPESDGFFAFSFGDQQYFTFMAPFDGALDANVNDTGSQRYGIFIYPSCNNYKKNRYTNTVPSGNASNLIPTEESGQFNPAGLRDALSGGDDANFDRLSGIGKDVSFPIKFVLTNNDINNTFNFQFSSPLFDGEYRKKLECDYNASFMTEQDFKLYFITDASSKPEGDESLLISSFLINEYVNTHPNTLQI